jgi:hypothetical protein
MKTKTQWTASDISGATSLPLLQVDAGDCWFDILETPQKIVFGGACNAGFLESGFIVREDGESLDDTLNELLADLETYYRDGANYVSRIVCNDRM